MIKLRGLMDKIPCFNVSKLLVKKTYKNTNLYCSVAVLLFFYFYNISKHILISIKFYFSILCVFYSYKWRRTRYTNFLF